MKMDWPFGERQYECFGGPMDGKTLPMPFIPPGAPNGLNAFVVHLDEDNVPHFYVMNTRVDTETLDADEILTYAGTTPTKALATVREVAPEVAEQIENDLTRFITNDPFFQGEDDDECDED